MGTVMAVIFLVLILVVIESHISAVVIKKLQLAVGTCNMFWNAVVGNNSIMGQIAVTLTTVRKVLDQPTNTTCMVVNKRRRK